MVVSRVVGSGAAPPEITYSGPVAIQQRPRTQRPAAGRPRSPDFKRFIITGVILGFIVGGALSVIGDEAPGYGAGSQIGYLGVMGAFLGALVAALAAVLLDRRR